MMECVKNMKMWTTEKYQEGSWVSELFHSNSGKRLVTEYWISDFNVVTLRSDYDLRFPAWISLNIITLSSESELANSKIDL
jgi:hypothetical protein